MRMSFTRGAATVLFTTLCGRAQQQQLVERTQPTAVQVAQKRGAFELDCPAGHGRRIERGNDAERS
jgi:hypothetical protein